MSMEDYTFSNYQRVRTVQGYKARVMYFAYAHEKMRVEVITDDDALICRHEFDFWCELDGTDGKGKRLVYHEDEWRDMVGPYADLFDTYKPGDRVLITCRNPYDMTNIWRLAQLSHLQVKKVGDGMYDVMFVLTHGSVRRDPALVKPYKGNEYLVGTRVA